MAESSARKYKAQIESLTKDQLYEMSRLMPKLSEAGPYFEPSQAGVINHRGPRFRLRLQVFEKLIEFGYLEEWNRSSKKTLYHKKNKKGLDGFGKALVS